MNKKECDSQISIHPNCDDETALPIPRFVNVCRTDGGEAKSLGNSDSEQERSEEFLMEIVAERSRLHRIAIHDAGQPLAPRSALDTDDKTRKAGTKEPREEAPLPFMSVSIGVPGPGPVAPERADSMLVEEMQVDPFDYASGIPGAHAVGGRMDDPERQVHENDEASQPADIDSMAVGEDQTASVEEIRIDEAVVVDRMDVESGDISAGTAGGSTEPEREVVQGKILRDHPAGRKGTRRNACTFAATLGCVVLVVILAATAGHVASTDSPTDSSSQTPPVPTAVGPVTDTNVTYPPFQDGLPLEIVKGVQDLGSAYYLANAWMWQDPFLHQYSADRQYQRYTLVWFYFLTNGANWTRNDNWLSYTVSECEWFEHNSSLGIHGWHEGEEPVSVCDEDGNLSVLNVSSNNLQGTFPLTSAVGFKAIRIVDVSNNDIHGSIPNVGAYSFSLEVFAASNNKLGGHLTGGAGFSAFNVRVVKIDGNQIFGWHSAIYEFLPKLEVLDLSGNRFEGEMSSKLRLCKNLTFFSNRGNYFSGSIPSELGELSLLRELDVSGNSMIQGCVPSELANVPNLARLSITGTSIAGTMPEALCAKANKGDLVLTANTSVAKTCH